MVLVDVDLRMRADALNQGALDREPSEIVRVEDPALGVPTFTVEIKILGRVGRSRTRERYTVLNELAHALGPLVHAKIDDRRVAEASPRAQGILNVRLKTVGL
jgi:hypothetical protein